LPNSFDPQVNIFPYIDNTAQNLFPQLIWEIFVSKIFVLKSTKNGFV